MAKVYLKNNNTYKEVSSLRTKDSGVWSSKLTVSQIFKKISGVWTTGATSTGVSAYSFGGFIETTPEATGGTLTIGGAWDVSATTCQYIANYGSADVTNSATWSITSGGTYASISSTGLLTVKSGANNSNVTIQCVYQGQTVTLNVKVTYVSGASSQTTTSTTTDESGNTVNTTTTTTTNGTGTTTQTTTVVVDSNGDPIHKENESTDTQGNVNTQEIAYDSNGNEVVTGYTIDTSGNQSGGETLTNGLDTGVMAFDGHNWTATLRGKFPCSVMTQNVCPVIDCSYVENKKVNGFVIVGTPSYGGNHYNEKGESLATSSSNMVIRFRANKWQNGSTSSDSTEFYHKQTTAYSSYRFGTRTANVELEFRLTCTNNIITSEIWYNGAVVAKPKYSRTYGFSAGLEGVTFEIGKWTNNNETDYYWTFEVLDFSVQKTS